MGKRDQAQRLKKGRKPLPGKGPAFRICLKKEEKSKDGNGL